MNERVGPALTREEWEELPIPENASPDIGGHESSIMRLADGDRFVIEYDGVWCTIGSGETRLREQHRMAALALHGQPFGFTHAHVELLRSIADKMSDDCRHTEAEVFSVETLAGLIAALLPPEHVEPPVDLLRRNEDDRMEMERLAKQQTLPRATDE